MSPIANDLRRALKDAKKRGESYRTIAEKTGVSLAVISRFVNDKQDITLSIARKIGKHFDIDVYFFFISLLFHIWNTDVSPGESTMTTETVCVTYSAPIKSEPGKFFVVLREDKKTKTAVWSAAELEACFRSVCLAPKGWDHV